MFVPSASMNAKVFVSDVSTSVLCRRVYAIWVHLCKEEACLCMSDASV